MLAKQLQVFILLLNYFVVYYNQVLFLFCFKNYYQAIMQNTPGINSVTIDKRGQTIHFK